MKSCVGVRMSTDTSRDQTNPAGEPEAVGEAKGVDDGVQPATELVLRAAITIGSAPTRPILRPGTAAVGDADMPWAAGH